MLQIVVEESVLKSLLTQWEQHHEPASLAVSHKLATENFCRLKEVANASGEDQMSSLMRLLITLSVSLLKPEGRLAVVRAPGK